MDSSFSRSEKKRRAKDIEQLAGELALLTENEIGKLPCAEEIKGEIRSAKDLKGGARKRQLKYATKLLRDNPVVDELFDFLARRQGSLLKRKRQFHHLEHLRDLLLNEVIRQYEENVHGSRFIDEHEPLEFSVQSEALAAISEQFPDIELGLLKDMAIRFARTRNKKISRELFRILKASFDKMQYSKLEERKNGI